MGYSIHCHPAGLGVKKGNGPMILLGPGDGLLMAMWKCVKLPQSLPLRMASTGVLR